jgi:hypothetical protein
MIDKVNKVIIITLTIFYVIPIFFIPIYYNNSIPTLFELSSYPFVIREKLTISYFYSPVSGLIISIILIIIYYKILSEKSILSIKIILMSIFFIITIKIGIPSIKIIFYSNNLNKNIIINNIFNNLELSLFKINVIALGIGIYLLIRKILIVIK